MCSSLLHKQSADFLYLCSVLVLSEGLRWSASDYKILDFINYIEMIYNRAYKFSKLYFRYKSIL